MWIEFTPLSTASSDNTWRGNFRLHTSWEVSHSNAWSFTKNSAPWNCSNISISRYYSYISAGLVSTCLFTRALGTSFPSIRTTTLVGFWPAQLSLRILSRKVLQECRCQQHVKPPTWRRTRDLERSIFRHKRPPASGATLANPAAEGGTMGGKWPRNFAESADFHVTFGFFYMT
jgi:hypothetical protein